MGRRPTRGVCCDGREGSKFDARILSLVTNRSRKRWVDGLGVGDDGGAREGND